MIGIDRHAGLALILRVAVYPSMIGSCISIRIKSGRCFVAGEIGGQSARPRHEAGRGIMFPSAYLTYPRSGTVIPPWPWKSKKRPRRRDLAHPESFSNRTFRKLTVTNLDRNHGLISDLEGNTAIDGLSGSGSESNCHGLPPALRPSDPERALAILKSRHWGRFD